MEHIKKIIVTFIALFIAVSPIMANCSFSYADGGGGGGAWSQVTTKDEVVASFRAYCASRHAYINGNANDNNFEKALVSFTYNTYTELCALLGLDPVGIQAGLWYTYTNNGYLRFMYNDSALQDFNSLYGKLLEKYNLQNNEETILFNGETFTDLDNNTCLIFELNYNSNTGITNYNKIGSIYKYYGSFLYSDNNFPLQLNFNINSSNNNLSYTCDKGWFQSTVRTVYVHNSNNRIFMNGTWAGRDFQTYLGGTIILKERNITTNTYTYFLCTYIDYIRSDMQGHQINKNNLRDLGNLSVDTFSAIGKMGIPTNPFADHEAGKKAIIDAGIIGLGAFNGLNDPPVTPTDNVPDDNIPEPPNDNPSGGGGDTNYGPFNVFGFINANGEINFTMPNPSDIAPNGFSIQGLIQKFPFCVPLDIYAILDLCDADPVTPRFRNTINFTHFTYDLDINLTQFDEIMVYFRKLILILYIFGIIFITPYIVK